MRTTIEITEGVKVYNQINAQYSSVEDKKNSVYYRWAAKLEELKTIFCDDNKLWTMLMEKIEEVRSNIVIKSAMQVSNEQTKEERNAELERIFGVKFSL